MSKLDLLLYNINTFRSKNGLSNRPVLTISYDFWQGCISEMYQLNDSFKSDTNLGDYFLLSGCKVVWSYAIKGSQIIIGAAL